MTPVSIQIVGEASEQRYRASAGKRQSTGRTAGEALDALLALEGKTVDSSAILIQRFIPDRYFTRDQHDRIQELNGRRGALTQEESAEFDELIDAELDATVIRTDSLLPSSER